MRKLKTSDTEEFFDIMGNKKVMSPIPLETFSKQKSDLHLLELIQNKELEIFAITLKSKGTFIGFCAVVKDNEILYRLRPKYWKKGYGKEAVFSLVDYCFQKLNKDFLKAEVNKTNIGSIKILEHLFIKTGEYFNDQLNCTNYTYRKQAIKHK